MLAIKNRVTTIVTTFARVKRVCMWLFYAVNTTISGSIRIEGSNPFARSISVCQIVTYPLICARFVRSGSASLAASQSFSFATADLPPELKSFLKLQHCISRVYSGLRSTSPNGPAGRRKKRVGNALERPITYY